MLVCESVQSGRRLAQCHHIYLLQNVCVFGNTVAVVIKSFKAAQSLKVKTCDVWRRRRTPETAALARDQAFDEALRNDFRRLSSSTSPEIKRNYTLLRMQTAQISFSTTPLYNSGLIEKIHHHSHQIQHHYITSIIYYNKPVRTSPDHK